jgi:uncharacterized protein (TIGR00297 family)
MLDSAGVPFAILILAGIGVLAFATLILDFPGTVAGLVVGSAVLFFGGWDWFILLFTFFLVSGIATRYKYEQKRRMGVAEGLAGTRGWRNVVANGALSMALAVAYGLTSFRPFAYAYLGAVSTSMADTLATELGLLNPYEPRLITHLTRTVPAGTSGAVSPYGEVATLLGAGVLSEVAWVIGFGSRESIVPILVLVGGFLGSTFDSLLGATIQLTYLCGVCGRRVEKPLHCGKEASHASGLRFMDNNVVNFLATLFGALTTVLLSYLLPFPT